MSSQPSFLDNPETALAVLQSLPCAVVDSRGRVIEVNAPFAEKLNRPASVLIGVDLVEMLRGVSVDQARSTGADCFHLRTAEIECWIRLDRVSIANGARELVMLSDVSREWRALSTMVVAMHTRDNVLTDAEIGTWRFDPDTELYDFSNEISLGHSELKKVPLATLRKIQHPDDMAKDADVRDRLTKKGGTASGEMRYRDADGGWKTLRVHYRSGRQLPSGKFEMFGVSQNVTELARARDQADLVSERLELAMAAGSAGVYEIDMSTGQQWSSDQFKALVGADAMERAKTNPFGLYMDEEQATVRESWDRVVKSSNVEGLDTRIYRPDGVGRWVRVFTRVQRDGTGRPTRAVGLMLDIHSHKMQELALVEAKKLAEAATVAKSAFLATMSHEIRTPLNGILGMAQVLQADQLTDAQKERVTIISESGQTLMALLNDVLDISKIEAGKLDIARVDGDLQLTVERVRQLFQSRAAERGLAVSLEVSDNLPKRLNYDAVRVRQCVSNLLSNAIKFTEHGRITVRLGAEKQADGAWTVQITVADTGIGMDRATMDRLFAHFTQADATITRRFGGTGLGLAITRQLARLMGGDVHVVSRPGEGSTFRFTFAAAEGAAAAPVADEGEAPAAPVETTLKQAMGARVLLVDDNAVNRNVVKLFMASLGPRITEAVNGQDALDKLAAQDFDIVLLDVHMPVMDGMEAIKRIRSSDAPWRDIPVIALTADAMSGDRERFLAMGMSDYLSKPIDARELASKYVNLLQGKKPGASTRAA
ncbi:MAG TPA: ATP-binding protein [Hyphomonadaceae bacterium]|jgi:PAS domain S-box-containing protein|nr:ATP-binding protein [Hyphomonadaceae bacterium]